MKTWISHKRNQITIFLLLFQIFIIFNFILPPIEKIPYYRNKIAALKKEFSLYSIFSLHTEDYKKKQTILKENLENMQKQIRLSKDTTMLQKKYGNLHKIHQLTVVAQRIDTNKIDNHFQKITTRQTLEGSYLDLMNYLKNIQTVDPHSILSTCDFQNLTPLQTNPVIQVTLEINSFFYSLYEK